jgi:hypothetical protein
MRWRRTRDAESNQGKCWSQAARALDEPSRAGEEQGVVGLARGQIVVHDLDALARLAR